MKFSDLKGVFAQEQTSRGLLVIGLDAEGRQVEVLFYMTNGQLGSCECEIPVVALLHQPEHRLQV